MVARRWALWPLLQVFHRARRMGLWAEMKPLLKDRLFPVRIAPTKERNPSPPDSVSDGNWLLGFPGNLRRGQARYRRLTERRAPVVCRISRCHGGGRRFALPPNASLSKRGCLFARPQRLLCSFPPCGEPSDRSPWISEGDGDHVGEIHYQAFGNLLHSVQTGSPAFNQVYGASLFDYLRQNVDAADTFNQGMANVSSMLAYAVLMAYDFAGISSIVDIGGGQGNLLETILQFNPDIAGTVFDTASTINIAKRQLGNNTWGRRCSYVTGDFFTSVPQGADAYLLCGVIHDWDDRRAVAILKNCRKAMTKNSKVLLVDMVVPDAASASFSKLLDLNMLVMNGGRERTIAEVRALLCAAGCVLTRIVPTMAPQSVIEAIAN